MRLFLGSVAETVLRHAPCATLVMPPIRRLSDDDDAPASQAAPSPARVEMASVE